MVFLITMITLVVLPLVIGGLARHFSPKAATNGAVNGEKGPEIAPTIFKENKEEEE